jgi:hypothetical protein
MICCNNDTQDKHTDDVELQPKETQMTFVLKKDTQETINLYKRNEESVISSTLSSKKRSLIRVERNATFALRIPASTDTGLHDSHCWLNRGSAKMTSFIRPHGDTQGRNQKKITIHNLNEHNYVVICAYNDHLDPFKS